MIRSRQQLLAFTLLRRLRAGFQSLQAPAVVLWSVFRSHVRTGRGGGHPRLSDHRPSPAPFFAGAPAFEFFEESGLARLLTSMALVGVGFAFGVLARSSADESQDQGEEFDSANNG